MMLISRVLRFTNTNHRHISWRPSFPPLPCIPTSPRPNYTNFDVAIYIPVGVVESFGSRKLKNDWDDPGAS